MGVSNQKNTDGLHQVLATCNLLKLVTEETEFFCSFAVQRLPSKNMPAMFTFDISVKHYQRSPVQREADTDGCKQLQVSCSQLLTSDEGF